MALNPLTRPGDTLGNSPITPQQAATAGSGDVVGPAGATDGHLALFDGTTGKLIKDGAHQAGGGGDILSNGTVDFVANETFQLGMTLTEQATPAPPVVNEGVLFTRANGSNIELVFMSSQGLECVLNSLPDNTVTAELQLNWVE